MSTHTLPAHGLLHMGVGVFRVLQIQALRNTSAVHLEGQEVFRLLEQTFTGLSAMIDKNSGEELETRLRKLLLLQEQTAGYLAQNGQPRPDQLRALLDAAADLEAWVPIKLRNCPLGAPERFPFVAALTYARSSCSDAVLLQGGNNQFEEQALQRLRDEVSTEAYALCHDQTLYALAILRFPALLGYVLLRRGLGGAGSVQMQASGFPMVAYGEQDTSWDPGLAVFRRLLTTTLEGPPCTNLPLKTVADYEWLISWAQLDKENFNVHSIKEVKAKDVLQVFGIDSKNDAFTEDLLREVVLAGSMAFENFGFHFTSEFLCKPPFIRKSEFSIEQNQKILEEKALEFDPGSWVESVSAMDFIRGAGYGSNPSILYNFEPPYQKIFAYIFSRVEFVVRTKIFDIKIKQITGSISISQALLYGNRIAYVRNGENVNDYKVSFAGSKNLIYELSPIKSKPGWWPSIYIKFASPSRILVTYSPSSRRIVLDSKIVEKVEEGEEVQINWGA